MSVLVVLFIFIALLIMPVVFLGITVRMKLTPLNALCVALLASTAFSGVFWSIINKPETQKQILKFYKTEFEKQLAIAEKQMKEKQNDNVDYSNALQTLKDNFDETAEKAILLLPGLFIFLWHLVTLGVLYSTLAKLSPKLGYKIEPLPAFKDWTFDWNLVWLYIFGSAMYFGVGSIKDIPGVKIIQLLGVNCFIISSILYMIIGFSLLFFMYDKYKIRTINRVGLSLLALIFSQFLVWLGLIDVWAEFRLKKATPDISDNSDDDDFFDY